jgi:hypothetical protein
MAKKKQVQKDTRQTIAYKDTPFTVDSYTYGYDDDDPDRLLIEITVIAPQSVEPDYLTMSFPFNEIVRICEGFEEPEAKYIRSVINAFSDKPHGEQLAFESLEFDEVFDMHAFLTSLMSKVTLTYDPANLE